MGDANERSQSVVPVWSKKKMKKKTVGVFFFYTSFYLRIYIQMRVFLHTSKKK